jgi:hypothetical protein
MAEISKVTFVLRDYFTVGSLRLSINAMDNAEQVSPVVIAMFLFWQILFKSNIELVQDT